MSRVFEFPRKCSDRRSSIRRAERTRPTFSIEPMESRLLLSVTAVFSPITEALMVLGDTQSNTIEISRDEGGNILVNGGDVRVVGGTPTVANTSVIQIVGQAGNDFISLIEANGALPRTEIFGGSGDDILLSGSGGDLLFGQAGNDFLFGGRNRDLLAGGNGNDSLFGGPGDDRDFGQSGEDRMVWNPGDDSDINEGGSGSDTVEVTGSTASESFTVSPDDGRIRFERVNPGPFVLDIGSSEGLIVKANDGDDSISAVGDLGNIQITGDGGAGNDTLIFNGTDAAESIHISDTDGLVLLTQDIRGNSVNLDAVELIDVNARGGGDQITVDDLSGTDAEIVRLNLAAPDGGGDGDVDTVTVNGTDNDDAIDIAGEGSNYVVFGLPTLVGVAGSDATDPLIVNARAGNDSINADTLPAATVRLVVNGGAGADSITGGMGRDLLIGGDGDDFIDGKQDSDVVDLGVGDDVFRWDTSDGSDTVLGDEGTDLLVFTGNDLDEHISASASADRVLLLHDIGGARMDLDRIERLEVNALGGDDTITVNSLAGTALTQVNLNLASGDGAGDMQPDTVVINGSEIDDSIAFSSGNTGVTIFGLTPLINIAATESAGDRLMVNALAGEDVLDASGIAAGAIQLTADGGDGDDALLGSAGNDVLLGGAGDDFLSGGDGVDIIDGGPGDDIEMQ